MRCRNKPTWLSVSLYAFIGFACQIYQRRRRGCLALKIVNGGDSVPERVLLRSAHRLANSTSLLRKGGQKSVAALQVQIGVRAFNPAYRAEAGCILHKSHRGTEVYVPRASHMNTAANMTSSPWSCRACRSVLARVVCARHLEQSALGPASLTRTLG